MQQESTAIRRRRARAGTVLAALLVGLGLQAPAFAKKDTRNNSGEVPRQEQRETASPRAGTSLDKIIVAVEKRYPGARVRKADPATIDGRRIYVLRLQKDEKVWNIKVDAETGKEL
jgi:uncharacterized membrane protein YkoI